MLVTTLIVEPAQAEFGTRLAQLGAPAAVIREVSTCVAAAPAALADVYAERPVQGVVSAIRVWTGMTTYQELLQAEVPACKAALEVARPFIGAENG
ncbi:hypothetical protein BKE38_00365 [Pseudoroseomonas deserti]|uniref:Uncharacterized protein n=1 Tax=Teichococcus deserti TaxID=1817963 RepID=A0A1V2HAR4_9PROT|nr:hypothetical protein [Pseudoroseomonas deserti]ONG59161.1 hypothetical protein BKE38_00365 [Pseudoroseomonas deserti]